MRQKIKIISIVLFFPVLIMVVSFGEQKARWDGTVEKENGVNVIKNPREPLYGEIELELDEDLSIGREDDGNYMFYRVRDIEVDSNGSIYVADVGNYRIQKFDRNGNYVQTFGRKGQGPGEFELPLKIRIDETTGNVYIKDQAYGIEIFNKKGNHIRGFKMKKSFSDFELDEDKKIIGVFETRSESSYTKSISKINLQGEMFKTYKEIPYSKSVKKIDGSEIDVFTGYDIFLSKINNQTLIFGWAKEYKLYVINNNGELLYKFEKDIPEQRTTAIEKGKSQKLLNNDYNPFYFSILTDCKGRIYIQTNNTKGKAQHTEKEAEIFNKAGYYLYKTTLPRNTYVIKNGFLYAHIIDEDKGMELVKRFRIKNWKQIKEGI
jgi:hypothetical protein